MRILLVDDDRLVTESFAIIFKDDPRFEVVGSAHDGKEALTFLVNTNVDVVLMDIQMPVMNGIEACAKITAQDPNIKVMMLTTFRDFRHVHQALHAGAHGYVLKSDDVSVQMSMIESVYHGQATLSKAALEAFTQTSKETLFSERENECLVLIAHGYSNKEMAARLFIGEGTVRNVISVMLDKLSLRDRTQLAIYYWQTVRD